MIEIPQSLIMGFIDDFDYMKYAFHISTVIVFVDKTDLLSVTEYTLFESNDLENVISQLKIHVRNKNIENILGG
jgi:DNA-binding transcriptional regulator WhiA